MRLRESLKTKWPVVAGALWLSVCACGMGSLWIYSNAPGPPGQPSPHFEPASLSLDPHRPTLVLFLHPRCPCSRATLSELERLQARRPGSFATRIVSCEPGNASLWETADLVKRAKVLDRLPVIRDRGGLMSRGAGARTSGTVALFAPDGSLLFWGGITPARGHEGDNRGSDAIITCLTTRRPSEIRTPVFGCPLHDPQVCDDAAGCSTHEPVRHPA